MLPCLLHHIGPPAASVLAQEGLPDDPPAVPTVALPVSMSVGLCFLGLRERERDQPAPEKKVLLSFQGLWSRQKTTARAVTTKVGRRQEFQVWEGV